MPGEPLSRRDFVTRSSAAAMGAMVVPRHVLGGPGYRAPSAMLNVAIVGAGGMGAENAQELGAETIVAVCDLDFGLVERKIEERLKDGEGKARPKGERWKEQYLKAAKYGDFREMLDKQRDIEAVVIATPDHAHAVIAQAAMEAGKHVYVQKPLTWSVHESRVLRRLARETGVVTQMGNQGHSSDDARRINEWIRGGVIGPVREVHVWTNRPIWAQGLARPSRPPVMPVRQDDRSWWPGGVAEMQSWGLWDHFTPPPGFSWDRYLGPVAREVPYHPIYHPFHWRGWVDFGVGALGDMGAHLVDHPYWALELGYPDAIETTSTPWGGGERDPVSYPQAMTVHYDFPARGTMPPVKLHWYDGGLMPARPAALPEDVPLDRTGGVLFVGDRGVLMHETYGANPRVYPMSLQEAANAVPESMPRIEGSHEENWAAACKGEADASCPFEYAGALTEVMLLGLVALRAGQGRKIHYDGANMRVTNVEEANRYLTREYRTGWEVR